MSKHYRGCRVYDAGDNKCDCWCPICKCPSVDCTASDDGEPPTELDQHAETWGEPPEGYGMFEAPRLSNADVLAERERIAAKVERAALQKYGSAPNPWSEIVKAIREDQEIEE